MSRELIWLFKAVSNWWGSWWSLNSTTRQMCHGHRASSLQCDRRL